MFRADEALRRARARAGLSVRDLAEGSGRPVSTISRIENGVVVPSVGVLDELLQWCGLRLGVLELGEIDSVETEEAEDPVISPPRTYPNPRNDDPWDNDAVHWLLKHPDVAARYKRGPLMECLRRQPNRLRNQPHRVSEAEELARRHGVVQREIYDPNVGKNIIRLVRTDPAAPAYPW